MGPCLSSDATAVNLREEETEGKLNKASETCCVIQEDLETCFQELKVQKKEYEECLNAVCPRLTDNNAPFSAFLDVLEPPGNNRQADGIGRRRALLKAAAYSKVIEKAKNHTSSISKGKKKAAKNKGPARKLPVGEGPNKIEQEVNLVSETSLSKFDFKGKRGQKREKLFKEKYHFLEGTNVKKGETK